MRWPFAGPNFIEGRDLQMDTLYIVMPAYNEQANIANTVRDWYPVVDALGEDCRLVIVDDGSKDDTYAILKQQAITHPKLIALNKPNGGHGATVLYAYHYALESGADYVFQTDSDGQTLASEFAPFWAKRADWDMVIGQRLRREDGFGRLVITRTLRATLNCFFHVYIPDANLAYRLLKAKPLAESLRYVPDGFYLANVLLSVIFAKAGRGVLSIPVTVRERQGGVNSINIAGSLKMGARAMRDLWRLRSVIRQVPGASADE
jgi:dolichol-phosphate mannosyltransferase